MDQLSPQGPVYQAGTLSGNPLAMAAGIATLRALREPGVYERLEAAGARFVEGLEGVFERHRIPHQVNHRGSMVGFFFTGTPVIDLASAKTSDTAFYARFFRALSPQGPVYQAGTLSGNPLAMAAGIATLRALREPGVPRGSKRPGPVSSRASRASSSGTGFRTR